jgi:predicted deacylase
MFQSAFERCTLRSGRTSGVIVLLGAVLVAAVAAPAFRAMKQPDLIIPGPGVTQSFQLSAYFRQLERTPGDTPVYIFNGRDAGGTMLVLGGTHGDEIAGYLAAVLLVEQARVLRGRLIVVPRANASGFTHNVAQEGHPQRISIRTSHGTRSFTYGARVTNPIHQWPDPQVYTLAGSGQKLSGIETRNLNRAYPGRPDGTLTERIAFAITSLIRQEKVDLAIDLHEAAPEYPVVNTIVAHERAMDLAALVNMNLQATGIAIGLEASPRNLHGLSHREWGDATSALAVLMETTNPAQGRLRGRTNEDLVTKGQDRFYVRASERNQLSVPFPPSGWPLDVRVARHIAGIGEFARSLGELWPEKIVALSGVPDYPSILSNGIGSFLR